VHKGPDTKPYLVKANLRSGRLYAHSASAGVRHGSHGADHAALGRVERVARRGLSVDAERVLERLGGSGWGGGGG